MMPRKLLIILGLILAAWSRMPAENVVIEPTSPPSYSEERPAFMVFKKIVISPRDSGSYDVEITMQGEFPRTFPKGRGASFTMSFDFEEMDPEKSVPTSRIPYFHEDLSVSFGRNIGDSKFDAHAYPIEFRKRSWEFKIVNFGVRKDTISFSLRSPLFALHPASKVVFRSNYMKATSPTQAYGALIHETTPVSPDSSASGGILAK